MNIDDIDAFTALAIPAKISKVLCERFNRKENIHQIGIVLSIVLSVFGCRSFNSEEDYKKWCNDILDCSYKLIEKRGLKTWEIK